jgi:ubiquinone biosynthesis protein
MEILHEVAAWVVKHVTDLPFDPVSVIDNFAQAMRYELDMQHEGRNTDIFTANLEPDEQACFPKVYWDVTRRRVLGLELIEGVQLSKWRDSDLSEEDRKTIVRNGAYTVLQQVLVKGFFHADPHPGNLFAMSDGKLCFIDCGMAGRVDRETVADLANLIHGTADNDIDKVFEAFMALGRVHAGMVDERAVRRDLQEFLDQFTAKSFSEIDMSAVLMTFTDGLRKHRIQCPGDIVLMIKALTTIEGVAQELDPEFDLITFARPHVERLIKQQYSPGAIRARLKKNGLAWLTMIERAPHQLRTMIERALRNELRVTVDVDGLGTMERTVHQASKQVSYAILVGSMIMASAVLVLAAGTEGHVMKVVGFTGFVISFGLAGLILLETWIRRPKKKRR